MKDRVQEIKELIDQLKEAEEVNLEVAKDLRETDQEISFFCYKMSELMKKAAEVMERQMPVAAEIEGGQWFLVLCLRRLPWADRHKGFILPALRQVDHVGLKLRFVGG